MTSATDSLSRSDEPDFERLDLQARIARLFVYPVKSCAGVELAESLLIETGLEFDRAWMVVDAEGRYCTQRELPRMALIRPALRYSEMVLRAPGMLALHIAFDRVEGPTRVRIWDDELPAYDMGDLAAQWFSDFLSEPGQPRRLRLVRFDPEQKRVSSLRWTGGTEALNAFSDGFPLLVASEASMDDFNARLASTGQPPIGIERFRPNLVLSGIEAHDEDRIDELRIRTDTGEVRLALVKPCIRCNIPDVDPATGLRESHVGATLNSYRADPRMQGATTFCMNAIVRGGVEQRLARGQRAAANLRFE